MTEQNRSLRTTIHGVSARNTATIRAKAAATTGPQFSQGSYVVHVTVSPSFELLSTAREALEGLLDTRDFLGIQLAHATGCMEPEDFESLVAEHLQTKQWDAEELRQRVEALVSLIRDRVDADVVSTVFKCDIEQAAQALSAAARRLASGEKPLALVAAIANE